MGVKIATLPANFSFLCTILIFYSFISSLTQGQLFWFCDKVKLTFPVAKSSAQFGNYGHYEGSCLRKKVIDGVLFVCEEKTFCGTGLRRSISTESDATPGQNGLSVVHFCCILSFHPGRRVNAKIAKKGGKCGEWL